MANIKSQIKRNRTNEKSRLRNADVRSRMRTMIKRARQAMEKGETDNLDAYVRTAISEIDRAAKKGVIHRNSASRKKSELQHQAAATARRQ